jgi:hypothetical protein
MAAKMLKSLLSRTSHNYTRMEAQVHEHDPAISRSSFDECLDRLHAERLKQWPNSTFEEDGNEEDGGLSFETASWRRVLFPDRSALPQNFGLLDRLWRMVTIFPIRDTSWMVGFSFTIGSAIFVANGFFLVLPLVAPSTDFIGQTPYATSASSVLGGVIFLIGGWAGILEGLNLKRGAEVTMTEAMTVEVIDMTEVHQKLQDTRKQPRIQTRSENEANSSTEHLTAPTATSISNVATNEITTSQPALVGSSTFIWWPSWNQFSSTYRYDLLFLAGLIQEIGAAVFGIATITSIPGVIDSTNTLLVSISNLFPAAFGGFLFLVAAILQITDAQEKRWKPLIGNLNWHIGVCNAIGSLGFLLAGALPLVGSEEATFQGILAGFWGSWAFLIGSVLQWYCAMGNYP